jgi:hypothetical protein
MVDLDAAVDEHFLDGASCRYQRTGTVITASSDREPTRLIE